MEKRIASIVGASAALMASAALAQTVSAPSSTNLVVAHGVHTAGNAAGLAPSAHEILAPVVAGTVPATRPFTQGVTAAGKDVSTGTYQTGTNVQTGGLSVAPTGALTPSHQALETSTAKALVSQTGTVATTALKVPTSSPNLVVAHGVHTAGNAVGLAPSAHEILAPVVAGTVPATRPFTQGVTAAGKDLSTGTYQTGTNIQTGGLSVAPTGALTPSHQALETSTAKALVSQTGTVVTKAITPPK